MASLTSASAPRAGELPRVVLRHSALVRVCHWVNALCFLILLMSGLQIFNAHSSLSWGAATDFEHPFLSFSAKENDNGDVTAGETTLFGHTFDTTGLFGASRGSDGEMEERGFPSWATLPAEQDLAMGRRWHFFFAWLLVINGLVYVANLVAARHFRDLWPSVADLRAIPRAVARSRPSSVSQRQGGASLQRAAEARVLKRRRRLSDPRSRRAHDVARDRFSVSLALALFHGRQSARTVHFVLAACLVAFVVVHLVMVLVSGVFNNMRSMITGRYRIEEDAR